MYRDRCSDCCLYQHSHTLQLELERILTELKDALFEHQELVDFCQVREIALEWAIDVLESAPLLDDELVSSSLIEDKEYDALWEMLREQTDPVSRRTQAFQWAVRVAGVLRKD